MVRVIFVLTEAALILQFPVVPELVLNFTESSSPYYLFFRCCERLQILLYLEISREIGH